MKVDINQLPIPDWQVHCPHCNYDLRGLPNHRCPECGGAFEMAELVKPWTRLRPPRFTGTERPLPDFGLKCAGCAAPLAGATGDACGVCGRAFDLEPVRPRDAWFLVDPAEHPGLLTPAVEMLLHEEQIPYVPTNQRSPMEIYVGSNPLAGRLHVASEFRFEFLWLIAQTRAELAARAAAAATEWSCAACREPVPGSFDACWNCGAERASPS